MFPLFDAQHVPPRVRAAMDYLEHCRCVTAGDCGPAPRELTDAERRVEAAAHEVLRLYFTGEMDYGDASPRAEVPEVSESSDA